MKGDFKEHNLDILSNTNSKPDVRSDNITWDGILIKNNYRLNFELLQDFKNFRSGKSKVNYYIEVKLDYFEFFYSMRDTVNYNKNPYFKRDSSIAGRGSCYMDCYGTIITAWRMRRIKVFVRNLEDLIHYKRL